MSADKHPIALGQPTYLTTCWRVHHDGFVCVLPEGHEDVRRVRVDDNACGDPECCGLNRGAYCQECGDEWPCEVESIRARIVAAMLAFASQHRKWDSTSTHYKGCWQAHSECMASILLDIAREA